MDLRLIGNNMKKLIFFIVISWILPSCIEITQEIQLKKNGSGKAVYTYDISRMREMMKSLGEENSKDLNLGSMDEQFANYSKLLKEIEGISHVKYSSKNYVYQFSFHFKNVHALNQALNLMNNGTKSLNEPSMEFIKLDNNQIIVRNFYNTKKINNNYLGSSTENESDNQENGDMGDQVITDTTLTKSSDQVYDEMFKTFFADASYTTIIKVYRNVVSNSHPYAETQGKKVTLKIPLIDLDKPENQQNIITLK